jgi:hypothetical protein
VSKYIQLTPEDELVLLRGEYEDLKEAHAELQKSYAEQVQAFGDQTIKHEAELWETAERVFGVVCGYCKYRRPHPLSDGCHNRSDQKRSFCTCPLDEIVKMRKEIKDDN